MKKEEKGSQLKKAAKGVWTGARVLWLILGIVVAVALFAVLIKVGITLKDFWREVFGTFFPSRI